MRGMHRWLALLLLAVAGAARPTAAAETVNRIVAVVNDAIITQADVVEEVSSLLEEQRSPAPDGPDAGRLQQAVLDRLIERQLLLQEAKRVGATVGTDEVVQRLEAIRQRFGSEDAFRESLRESGTSEEVLKEHLRDQLLVQRLIDAKIRATIVVSPQEVAKALEQHPQLAKSGDRVQASHILIRTSETRSEEQAKALMEQLHQQLKAGADFAELARRYSEDSYRDQGGRMDWTAQGELMPELDAALFSLPPGELSEPIRSRLGFHVVRVEDRRTASSLSLVEANRAIQQHLYQEKFEAALARWLDELKQRAYIQILTPEG